MELTQVASVVAILQKRTEIPLKSELGGLAQTHTFQIDGWTYKFSAFRPPGWDWQVEFTTLTPEGKTTYDMVDAKKKPPSPIKIFSQLSNALHTWITTTNPEQFTFRVNGFDESRVRLYDRLANQIAQAYRFSLERRDQRKDVFYTFHRTS